MDKFAVSLSGVNKAYEAGVYAPRLLLSKLLNLRRDPSKVFPALVDLSLEIKPGESVGVVGLNGSGKSTFANVLAGREDYAVDSGSVQYQGLDLLDLDPEERACEGIFLAFQYPVSIPGISNAYFLRSALNAVRRYREEGEVDAVDFLQLVRSKMELVGMDEKEPA